MANKSLEGKQLKQVTFCTLLIETERMLCVRYLVYKYIHYTHMHQHPQPKIKKTIVIVRYDLFSKR